MLFDIMTAYFNFSKNCGRNGCVHVNSFLLFLQLWKLFDKLRESFVLKICVLKINFGRNRLKHTLHTWNTHTHTWRAEGSRPATWEGSMPMPVAMADTSLKLVWYDATCSFTSTITNKNYKRMKNETGWNCWNCWNTL